MAAQTGLLAGRLALVTGAGSGIGRAVCQVFAKEGAALAVVDVNQSAAHDTISSLPQGSGQLYHAFCADVSSSGSIGDLMQNVQASFNAVPTIGVNSAGITKDTMMLKMSEENFVRVMDVNLKGTFLLNQAIGRALVSAKIKKASLVNISSITAKTGNIGQANYAASKAGVIGLTKTAAKELAGTCILLMVHSHAIDVVCSENLTQWAGIRVNAVLPGFIVTPMTNVIPDKVKDMVNHLTPLGRMGEPEEIAEACLFLASDKSSYITGVALEVSGGLFM